MSVSRSGLEVGVGIYWSHITCHGLAFTIYIRVITVHSVR